jgi:uncharacterized membrane protein HdeD (DUF308 family)
MTAGMRGDPAGTVARVGRHWGWVLAFGIITLLIGIVAPVWPRRTLLVVAVLFGIQLIVMGIVSVLAGIVVLVYPGISLLVLAVVLGIWLIVFGSMQIMVAFRIRSSAHA